MSDKPIPENNTQKEGQPNSNKAQNKNTNEYDIFIANSIFPDAKAIFSTKFKSVDQIKNDCIFILDTNVLLLPYNSKSGDFIENFMEECRQKFKPLIEKNKLLIPGQVAREFAKNRPSLLANLYKDLSDNKSKIQPPTIPKIKSPLLVSVSEYQDLVKIEAQLESLISGELKNKLKEYQDAVGKVLERIASWNWDDPVSSLYNELFTETTIEDFPITNKEDLKKDLLRRQTHKIPPGYKDSGKEDNGIGDLLIWLTILEVGKKQNKSVIFISNDTKADWWQQSGGQALYPRYELIDEFRHASNGQTLHTIKFSEFLKSFGASDKTVNIIEVEEKLQTPLLLTISSAL